MCTDGSGSVAQHTHTYMGMTGRNQLAAEGTTTGNIKFAYFNTMLYHIIIMNHYVEWTEPNVSRLVSVPMIWFVYMRRPRWMEAAAAADAVAAVAMITFASKFAPYLLFRSA